MFFVRATVVVGGKNTKRIHQNNIIVCVIWKGWLIQNG